MSFICPKCKKEIPEESKQCPNCGVNLTNQTKKDTSKRKKKLFVIIPIVLIMLVIIGVGFYNMVFIPMINYNRALELKELGKYEEAIEIFDSLGDYSNSEDELIDTKYDLALSLGEKGEYSKSISILGELGDYKAAEGEKERYQYELAIQYYNNGDYEKAKTEFDSLGSYEDSIKYYQKSCNRQICQYIETNPLETSFIVEDSFFEIEISADKHDNPRIILTQKENYDYSSGFNISPVIMIHLDCTETTNKVDLFAACATGLSLFTYDGYGIIDCGKYNDKVNFKKYKVSLIGSNAGISKKQMKSYFEKMTCIALMKADDILQEAHLGIDIETFGYVNLYED